jgi:hypothetical protein
MPPQKNGGKQSETDLVMGRFLNRNYSGYLVPMNADGLPARWPRSSVPHVAAGELTPAGRHKRGLWLRL